MDLIHKAVLSKNSISKNEKDLIPAGVYEYDFVARFRGVLTKGEDTDKIPTCSIPIKATIAMLIRRMGFTRDDAIALLVDVMTEAIELDKNASNELLDESGVLAAYKAVEKQVLDKLPRTPVIGRLDGRPVVELVGIVEEKTNLETGEVQRLVTTG
tara:strand:- start:49 stop:516 length:468 start_codon:yes stop_codon:yes gene_type:complete